MYSNEEATLTLYKDVLQGQHQDYVIRFNHEQQSIEEVIQISSDIVKLLIDEFHQKDKTIKGRLVARMCYIRINKENDTADEITHYIPSYRSEIIDNAQDFFITHMMKIGQRMENFNANASNLIIHNISEIHLHVHCMN